MYGARSGKVVRRVSSLASPRLTSKASGGESTASETEVVVLRNRNGHAVDVDRSRGSIASMILGHIEGWASSINRRLAVRHVGGIG
jgi:hypothetical protein